MMRPNIFIAGPSGSGKSTSLRNLPPEETVIINTERKVLPFRGAKKFKKQVMVDCYDKFQSSLNRAIESDCKTIVIDSFTSLTEMVHDKAVRSRPKSDGFDAWADYGYILHDILLQCKNSGKFVVFIGIDDVMQDHEMRITRTAAVQGRLKGKVEKEFEIVLWTVIADSDNGPRYCFMTNTDGSNKAKTPMGMFDERLIDNDLSDVIQRIEQYYQEEDTA